eukprot:2173506-Rhodomonas_salina.2
MSTRHAAQHGALTRLRGRCARCPSSLAPLRLPTSSAATCALGCSTGPPRSPPPSRTASASCANTARCRCLSRPI